MPAARAADSAGPAQSSRCSMTPISCFYGSSDAAKPLNCFILLVLQLFPPRIQVRPSGLPSGQSESIHNINRTISFDIVFLYMITRLMFQIQKALKS